MRSVGQLCLLTALVSSGYGAYVYLAFRVQVHPFLKRAAAVCGLGAIVSLSGAVGILVWALLEKNFDFQYVAQYSSRLLPWHYSFSALWVGQAGSLLLWTWFLGAAVLTLRLLPTADERVRDTASGLLLGNLTLLVLILVFSADPFKGSLRLPKEGLGLSPLLQHPSMLVHPPVTFLAYATWAVPCALALGALIHGRLDATWTHMARPWALLSWAVLGIALLLGADWAYQQLGWGGYWGWDPVENGSLLPWLTGTALIHCLMAWRYRDSLKKSTMALVIITYGLCNFATFVTRGGLFSSVHAFSQSPIGWMFLVLMAGLVAGGGTLIVLRRHALAPGQTGGTLLSRGSLVLGSTFLLVLFALAVLASTLVPPLSAWLLGRTVVIGPPFYNNVLIPVGLALLAFTGAVPLLAWGEPPTLAQRRVLWISLGVGVAGTVFALCLNTRHGISLAVAGLCTSGVCADPGSGVSGLSKTQAASPLARLAPSLVPRAPEVCRLCCTPGVFCPGSRYHRLVRRESTARGGHAPWRGHYLGRAAHSLREAGATQPGRQGGRGGGPGGVGGPKGSGYDPAGPSAASAAEGVDLTGCHTLHLGW